MGESAAVREYVWLDDLPVAVLDGSVNQTNPSLFWVHADHLNRPVLMTDATKAVVWRAFYEPFGAVHSITGPAANDNRFPGQMFQLETGLAYNWHRHYDATIGRYTQADPLGLKSGANLFAYALQNPVSNFDSSGLYTEVTFWNPDGSGSGAWGHVSGNINGMNFSYGPGGWDTRPLAADYTQRQIDRLRRDGRGVVLDLSPAEESNLAACLLQAGARPYNSITNNCGNPWLQCLQKQNVVDPTDKARVLPIDVESIIRSSPRVIGSTVYSASEAQKNYTPIEAFGKYIKRKVGF